MINKELLYDEPLEERINLRTVAVDELRTRAINVFNTYKDNLPMQVGDEFGCPVCLSKLSKENRLVRENGYIMCDYCVNYVVSD